MDSQHPSVLARLLRYVRFDTQSDERSTSRPSTDKQLALLETLRDELIELGAEQVTLDEQSYVTATLPSNVDIDVPTIGLIAHVDTSPEMSGENVNPKLHPDYDGGELELGDGYVLGPERSPELLGHRGHTIVTTDGTTLLGADNKAGIAEIMTLLERLIADPSIPHGPLRVAFTYDEEIGRGTETFDLERFGAEFAYTIDGETVGQIENETFCADAAEVTIKGVNVHPGYAKGKLVNALKIAARFIESLPPEMCPERTEGREGYVHPVWLEGSVDEAVLKMILRDFDAEGLAAKGELLRQTAARVEEEIAGADITVEVSESYRNMRMVFDEYPGVVELALEATRRAGYEPTLSQIRGGTDGAHLSLSGLPTPNIFTGGHLYHSRYEWVAVEGMLATVATLEHLVQLWVEKTRAGEAPRNARFRRQA